MKTPNLLDAFTFPLQGNSLIEASAGTGKTYTISNLYLRLLLGEGNAQSAFGRPLNVDEILLLTFTDAATQELKGRIRTRIIQAKKAFLAASAGRCIEKDSFIRQLLQVFPDATYLAQAHRLDWAEKQMDTAAIFTIHGFCQRMLVQNAFECGQPFELALIKDEKNLLTLALLDFWRESLLPLSEKQAALVYQHWPGPQKFFQKIHQALSREHLVLEPRAAGAETAQLINAYWLELDNFKRDWLNDAHEIAPLIQQSGVDKRSYSSKHLPDWLAQVNLFCQSNLDACLPEVLRRFSARKLASRCKNANIPRHRLFDVIDALFEEEQRFIVTFKTRGIQTIKKRIKTLKNQQQVLGFHDLLSRLDDALQNDVTGQLVERIRTRYPVAMIDEFQDTDFTQYRIFSKIYSQSSHTAWFVIGDPKQAIYGFRGADIFTYMAAKKAIKQHYFLDTNWRSSQTMVAAVNTLFSSRVAPFFYDEAIPFLAVKAGGQQDAHAINTLLSSQKQGSQAALQFFYLQTDEPVKMTFYKQCMAEACCNEISRLLSLSKNEPGKQVKLQSNDIAVLVRDYSEAVLIQTCLAERQIESVYLSNRDSVFQSQEAHDLYLLLAAVLSMTPGSSTSGQGSERAIRSALSTALFGYDQNELEQQFLDEKKWLSILQEFKHYQAVLQRQGVLVMFYQVFYQRDLLAALASVNNYERRMTNVLHLVDLLQTASAEQAGIDELLHWFGTQFESNENGADEQLLRVDTDNNRVKIITLHKSKGLEYPIVFLPFACAHKSAKACLYYDENRQIQILDLSASEFAKAQAEHERLAEDMRLLYVALTRSKYRCYVGVADVYEGNSKSSCLHDSALGHLILNGEAPAAFAEKLRALKNQCLAIDVLPVSSDAQATRVFIPELPAQEPQRVAREFKGNIGSAWRIGSFTALTQGSAFKNSQVLSRLELDLQQEKMLPLPNDLQEKNNFSFPRGTEAGILLHSLFEEIDFTCVDETLLNHRVQKKLLLFGFDPLWQETVVNMIKTTVATALEKSHHTAAPVLRLNQIGPTKKLVEMEFTLPSQVLNSAALYAIEKTQVSEHDLPILDFEPHQGFIRGFIDLVFEWQGQFYVLDYKSNHLGNSFDDYQHAQLAKTMAEHHYSLQYLFYCLALHRYLQQRIHDYHYDRHFGGVYYLFIRGMQKDQAGSGVYFKKPERSVIELLGERFKSEP